MSILLCPSFHNHSNNMLKNPKSVVLVWWPILVSYPSCYNIYIPLLLLFTSYRRQKSFHFSLLCRYQKKRLLKLHVILHPANINNLQIPFTWLISIKLNCLPSWKPQTVHHVSLETVSPSNKSRVYQTYFMNSRIKYTSVFPTEPLRATQGNKRITFAFLLISVDFRKLS